VKEKTNKGSAIIPVLVLALGLPLFIWAIVTQKFDFRNRAASIEPTPSGNIAYCNQYCGGGNPRPGAYPSDIVCANGLTCTAADPTCLDCPKLCKNANCPNSTECICAKEVTPPPATPSKPTTTPIVRPTPTGIIIPTPILVTPSSKPTMTPPSYTTMSILTNFLPIGRVGRSYKTFVKGQITDSGFQKIYPELIINGLPSGLGKGNCISSLNSTGTATIAEISCPIVGIPKTRGAYKINIILKDQYGHKIEKTLRLFIF
jgi:hypothetical protein